MRKTNSKASRMRSQKQRRGAGRNHGRQRAPRARAARFESLESRQMLAENAFSAPTTIGSEVFWSVDFGNLDSDTDIDLIQGGAEAIWYENLGNSTFSAHTIDVPTPTGNDLVVSVTDIEGDDQNDFITTSVSGNFTNWFSGPSWTHTRLEYGFFMDFGGIDIFNINDAPGARSVHGLDLTDLGVLTSPHREIVTAGDTGLEFYQWHVFISTIPPATNYAYRRTTISAESAQSVFVADIDGDNQRDILAAYGTTIAWFKRNSPGGSAFTPHTISTSQAANYVSAEDIDGDGDNDVLFADSSGNTVGVFQNNGAGSFQSAQIVGSAVNGAASVTAKDLDGDGDKDVISASSGDNTVAWYENLGSFSFGPKRIISLAAGGARAVLALDVNNDSRLDVVSGSAGDDKLVWYQNGDGFIVSPTTATVTEPNTTATSSVKLGVKPTSDVKLTVTASDATAATVSPATLTFTPSNWNTNQTVTITAVDDAASDGSQTSTITIAVDDAASFDGWDPLSDKTVAVTTNDNEASGFTLSTTTATVSEPTTTATFTAVLNAAPLTNVVLKVTSSDTGEVTASPAALTFTAANWNTAQTVTLTAVDDTFVDGPQNSTVTVSVDDAQSDNAFDPVPDQTVAVTVNDDDSGGFTISKTTATVSEPNTTDTFTVVLTAPPAGNVVFDVTSGDTGEVTVSPATLTFNSSNWNSAQTVTLTAANDAAVDGPQTSIVTISINDASSDNGWDPLADKTVSVTTNDDDVGAFNLSMTTATVSEPNTTATFTAVLSAPPAATVVLTVTSADVGEVTVSPASLSFNTTNWSTPQTVTLTAVNDVVVDGPQVTAVKVSVSDAQSDDAWDALADQTVSVTTTDDDVPGLTLSKSSAVVAEPSTTDSFTVALSSPPVANVVLTVTSSDTGEVTVLPATLTFTPANWSAAQTVTLTPFNDPTVDGPQTSNVTIAVDAAQSEDAWDGMGSRNVSVMTQDDDVPGFEVSTTTATVTEPATTSTFTVVLSAQPVTNVVFTVTSGDIEEVTVSAASLSFTPTTWSTPQTVTLTAADDPAVDGNQITQVTVAVNDSLSDNSWDPLPNQTVAVTTRDNDVPALVLSKTDATVTEPNTTDTFTVKLAALPLSDVVLRVTSSDIGEVTVLPTPLRFTPSNWSTPQVVTLTAGDDPTLDGPQTSTVTLSVDAGQSDDGWDGMTDRAVMVTTNDDDVAGFAVSAPPGDVIEPNTFQLVNVVLTAQPTSTVVLKVASDDTTEVSVSPVELTFAPADWNVAQQVRLTAVDDLIVDGPQTTTIRVSVDDLQSGSLWDPLADKTITIVTSDNDVPALALSKSSAVVSEPSTADNFLIALAVQPLTPVMLTLTSSDTGEATVSPATLTFTPANWNTAQGVTITAANDSIVDGPQMSTVTIAASPVGTDPAWLTMPSRTVTVTTNDDDVPALVLSKTVAAVNEPNSTDTFTVVLAAQPVTNVVLTVVSGDLGEVTVGPAQLMFNPSTWNTPQTVTLTAADDQIVDGPQDTSVTITVADALSDNAWDDLADRAVTVTTRDDDIASFVLSKTTATVSESGTGDSFTVVLNRQPVTDVVLRVTSGDTTEVTASPEWLTFTPGNWNAPQAVTLTPVDDVAVDGSRTSTVTVAVDAPRSDNAWDGVAPLSVTVTTTDNDHPSMVLSKFTALVSEPGTTDSFTVSIAAQPVYAVVFLVTTSDASEVTASPERITFLPDNWTRSFTITLTAKDDVILDGSQNATITVAVDEANSDAAWYGQQGTVAVQIADNETPGLSLSKTAALVTEPNTADTFTVALTSQPLADVVLTVTSSDLTEVTNAPLALTFTPANWNVAQPVILTAVDDLAVDGPQATQVILSVDDASSDPFWRPLADRSVLTLTNDNDVAGFTLNETTATVGEPNVTDTFTAVLNARPLTNVVLNIVSSSPADVAPSPASLVFTPDNWNQEQMVTLSTVDDYTVEGARTSTITVSVDDANSDSAWDPLGDKTIRVTTNDDDVAGFALTKTTATVDEPNSTDEFKVVLTSQPLWNVVLTVSSSDTGEVTPSPATLTFTPANWNAYQTVTLTAADDSIVDGPQTSTITVSVDDVLSDNSWDPVPDKTVTVTTTDNEVPSLILSKNTAAVNEPAGTDTFTVKLSAQPTTNVVVLLSSTDTGEVMPSPTTLTFSRTSWNTAYTVTLTAVDDLILDGTQNATINLVVDVANSDDAWDQVQTTVAVTIGDNETPGFNVSKTTALVTEPATTDSFTVVLTAQPIADVVLTVASTDEGEVKASPATLTFTAANWDKPQAVTLTAVDDLLVDGPQSTTVVLAVDDNTSDAAWHPVADRTVQVTTNDNDSAGFALNKTTATVGEPNVTDTFTAVLTAQPLTNVVLNIASSSPADVAPSPVSLVFTPSNWNQEQTVTLSTVDDYTVEGARTSTITVSVDDANSDSAWDPLSDKTIRVTTNDDDAAGFSLSKSTTTLAEPAGTDTVNVVLTSQPLTNVVLTVSSSDSSEVSGSPAMLTFTPANWNLFQTVTLAAADDSILDGSQHSTVSVSVDDTLSDNAWDPLADKTIAVTTTDNEVPALVLSKSTAAVSEPATTDTFTVKLSAQPATNVVVLLSSNDTTEVTPSPISLTFSPTNWNAAYTVTLNVVDDLIVDGTQNATIRLVVDAANSDDAWDQVQSSVAVTIGDNEAPGFNVSKTTATVTEPATTDAFTVVLISQPVSNVVLTVTSMDEGEVKASPATLTFTPANWNQAQMVTLTAVDDALVDGPQATTIVLSVDDVTSDPAWHATADRTVLAVTNDNDSAGFLLSKTTATVGEPNLTDTFTAVLTSQPLSDVVLNIVSSSPADVTPSVASLTFTPANWNHEQTVLLFTADDVVVEGTRTSTITVLVDDANSDSAFDPLADKTIRVTTNDDDAAGFVLSKSVATLAEPAGTDTVNVALTTQPLSNVVLTVSSSDTGEVRALPATLTFTPANWNVPQTVTLTATDDLILDGPQTSTVTVSVDDILSDNAWDPVADKTVAVTTTDNEVPSLILSKRAASVSEPATTDTFTVMLSAQPTTNVVVLVSSTDTGEVTASHATLTFSPTNWNVAYTVTLKATDDLILDGTQTATIGLAVDAANSDDAWDQVQSTVTVNVDDNEVPGLTLSKTTATVTEPSTTDSFTVVLTAQPIMDVVVTVTSGDEGEVKATPATLTFTAANWNRAQAVTLTAVDDALVDGPQSTTIVLSVDDNVSDPAWHPTADRTVVAVTNDNDSAGFTLSKATATVGEPDVTDTFTAVLTAQPLSDVVLRIVSSSPADVAPSVASLTFTPANWNHEQTVTLSTADDVIVEGTRTSTVTVLVDDANSDSAWDPLADKTIQVTTNDNDVPGFSLSKAATTLAEPAGTDRINVALTSQPLWNVVLTVSSSDPGEVTASPTTLTFTPSNWNELQTLTLTATDDLIVDGPQASTITLSVDDVLSENAWDPVADKTIAVTTTDNEAPALVLSKSTAAVSEPATEDSFIVTLSAQPTTSVVLLLSSSDTGEVTPSPATLTFSPTNWNRGYTVTLKPVDDVILDGTQNATITVAVDDANSDDAWDQVRATVAVTIGDNEAPGFTLSKTTASVSEPATTDSFTVVLIAQPVTDVVLALTSSDESEVKPAAPMLTFTAANWNKPQTVTLTAADDLLVDGTQVSTVTVAVDAAGSDNAWDGLPSKAVTVTTADDDVAGFRVSKTAASVSEDGTKDTFTVMLTAQPLSDVVLKVAQSDITEATASPVSMVFTPANWNVAQTVTVTGVDDILVDGPITSKMTVWVSDPQSDSAWHPVASRVVTVTTADNDLPGFSLSRTAVTVSEPGTMDDFTVVLTARPLTTVVLTISTSDPTEATASPIRLTFVPANWNISQTVTVTATDDFLIDGAQISVVNVSVHDAISDAAWRDLADQSVTVTTLDDVDWATIGGVKFNDLDSDGLRDENEPGMAGWTINLDGNGDGVADETMITAADGTYSFSNLVPRTYVIWEELATGWVQSTPLGGQHTIAVLPGQVIVNRHFGNFWPVAVGGPVSGVEGSALTLTAPLGAGYHWLWVVSKTHNDTTWPLYATSTASSLTFTPDDDGVYTVALRMTNAAGFSSTTTLHRVTIANLPPSASFGASMLGNTGTVSFSNQGDPGAADRLAGYTYAYDFDSDGVFEQSGSSPTAVIPTQYLAGMDMRIIRGRIYDKELGWTDYTTQLIVNRSPRVVDNDNSGFSILTGKWYARSNKDYYGGDYRYANKSRTGTVQWSFDGLSEGATYQVAATWVAAGCQATNAPYRVLLNGSELATVPVNQTGTPDDFTDGTAWWEELLVVQIPVDADPDDVASIQVQLSCNTGKVQADAVRVVGLWHQEIEVAVDGVVLADGQSTVDFTTAYPGVPLTKEFVVTNRGQAPLTVGGALSVPGGYVVTQGFPAGTVLDPGRSTTFRIQLNATNVGTYGGAVSFTSDDADEGIFNFNVIGTVDSRRIIDDEQAGFSLVGDWNENSLEWTAYGADYNYYRQDENLAPLDRAATWTFANLQPGLYRVYATWVPRDNAAHVYYSMTAAGSSSYMGAVDQNTAPNDLFIRGDDPADRYKTVGWEKISAVAPGGAFAVVDSDQNAGTLETLTVTLTASTEGYVVADAIRVEYAGSLSALVAADAPLSTSAGQERLTSRALAPIVREAIARWDATGLSRAQRQLLAKAEFVIQDLGGRTLALAAGGSGTIYLDDDAAGFGWFVDRTPQSDSEFGNLAKGRGRATLAPAAQSKMDLLTAVMHEMGHLLGKADLDAVSDQLMSGRLTPGVRRSPTPSLDARDAVFASLQ